MLTFPTRVIEHGTFREKLWNVLEKIYNPGKTEYLHKLNNRIKEITTDNQLTVCLSMQNTSEDHAIIIDEELPVVNVTKSNKTVWSHNIDAEFEYDSPTGKRIYKASEANTRYVYEHLTRDSENHMTMEHIAYIDEERGWMNVDKYIKGKHYKDGKIYTEIVFDDELQKEKKRLQRKYDIIYNIGNFVYKCLHTIDSCILCIRFPFLYQRNRWTNRHYNNWKIIGYCDKLKKENSLFVCVNVLDDTDKWLVVKDLKEIEEHTTSHNNIDDEALEYVYDDGNKKHVLYSLKSGTKLPTYEAFTLSSRNAEGKYFIYTPDRGILCIDDYMKPNKKLDLDLGNKNNDGHHMYRIIVFNKFKYKLGNVIMWLHDYVLAVICGIPVANELDLMDEGWRRRFGIDICKDVRKCLLKHGGLKTLFSYRIVDIKEKFGGLRWYDGGCPRELYDIIGNYETISCRTCIVCGKPARYITSGWICPFCEDHIGEESKKTATELDENGNYIKDDTEDGNKAGSDD